MARATGSRRAVTSRSSSPPTRRSRFSCTASEQERARRRAEQTGADVESVLADQRRRDARDASGERSVTGPAPGAVSLDTTGRSLEEVVGQIVTLAVEARALLG